MISFIIPFYNSRKYIVRCLSSFLVQTSKNFELVLVDDGSNDNSSELIKKFSSEIKIKLLRTNHEGVSVARNLGIKKANGNIIGFCDIDDIVSKDLVKTVINIFEKKKCDLVYTKAKKLFNKEQIELFNSYQSNLTTSVKRVTKDKFIKDILFNNNVYGAVWNKFFRKKIIMTDFEPSVKVFEDLLFNFENTYFNKELCIYKVNNSLYGYIDNKGSVTHSKINVYDEMDRNKYVFVLEKIAILSQSPKLIKWIRAKIFDMCVYTLRDGFYSNEIQKESLIKKIKIEFFSYITSNTYTIRHKLKTVIYAYRYILESER